MRQFVNCSCPPLISTMYYSYIFQLYIFFMVKVINNILREVNNLFDFYVDDSQFFLSLLYYMKHWYDSELMIYEYKNMQE